MSEQVERRLIEILGQPRESPYGNPIPGLEELGLPPADAFMTGVVSVLEALSDDGGSTAGVIRRLAEPVQFNPDVLARLKHAGILPGASARFTRSGAFVLVDVDGIDASIELPNEVAGHLFIAR